MFTKGKVVRSLCPSVCEHYYPNIKLLIRKKSILLDKSVLLTNTYIYVAQLMFYQKTTSNYFHSMLYLLTAALTNVWFPSPKSVTHIHSLSGILFHNLVKVIHLC